MRPRIPLSLACAIACALSPAPADCAAATWNAAYRQRLERVEQASFANDAFASTARLRLGGYLSFAPAWSAFLEAEAVRALRDDFNSGANGRTAYPAVADANATEVNQAGVAWRGTRADATLGRQRVVFDNQRFIGNVGWRQNEQTFDAAHVTLRPQEGLTMDYAWLARVHRVAGDHARDPLARERELDAHLWHASLATGAGPIAAYAYAVEDRDVATASSRTIGARWAGATGRGDWRLNATLEAARQDDHGNNPLAFVHGYRLLELGVGRGPVNGKLGFERLGGNGTHALQTPLATLHAFNGWADVFLVTPATGLEDRYATFGGTWTASTLPAMDWTVSWHDFRRTTAGPHHGTEWDASLAAKLGHGWSVLLKVADYRAAGFARDTRKAWLQLEWTR